MWKDSPIQLINISVIFIYILGVRTFRFCSLDKFKLHNEMLSTIVTMLCIHCSELTHLITENLYPFTCFCLLPFLPVIFSWQPLFHSFFFFRKNLCLKAEISFILHFQDKPGFPLLCDLLSQVGCPCNLSLNTRNCINIYFGVHYFILSFFRYKGPLLYPGQIFLQESFLTY